MGKEDSYERIKKLRLQMRGLGLTPPKGFDQEDYDFLMVLSNQLGGVRQVANRVMRIKGSNPPLTRPEKYFNKDRTLKKKELTQILKLSTNYKMPFKEDGESVSLHYVEESYPGAVSDSRCLLEIHDNQIPNNLIEKFYDVIRGSTNQELLEFYRLR